ncbi:hypothetical protein ACQRWP_14630 [Micromonospora trifolii]
MIFMLWGGLGRGSVRRVVHRATLRGDRRQGERHRWPVALADG